MLVLIAIAGVLCSGMAVAQEPKLKAATMRYVFEQWMQDNGITKGSFVTLYRGDVTGAPLNADQPVELASLSKAITAICAAQLIEQGVWTAQTTSAEVLGAGLTGITLAQLVTHTSGIGPDKTQGVGMLLRDTNAPLTAKVATAALARERMSSDTYFYNNENYAILGQMIARELDMPYAAACEARVLAPAGVTTAQTSPRMGGTLPWGGWAMSARDYARFHYYWFGPQGAYAAGAPPALKVDLESGATYGLGMFERASGSGRNFWHLGSWCMPFRLNTGAYAIIRQGEWSVVATYNACIEEDTVAILDVALSKVVYGR